MLPINMLPIEKLSDQLAQTFGAKLQSNVMECGEVTIEVSADDYLSVCETLRDDENFAFEILIDLCGIDYSAYGQDEWKTDASGNGFSRGVNVAQHGRLKFGDELPENDSTQKRFAAITHLLSIKNNHRLRVRVFAEDDAYPVVKSVVDIWNGVNWFEREAFDLYGIHFDGHPDLRRILTDYGFVGHPFRKDFPLSGNVEMRYDEEQKRVIYEPVSIEPRVLVPRVIRENDNHHHCNPVAEDSSASEK
ncbi:NADH-ubiquinone oxidoreductase chain C [hydrothermal vent metagenome]|uniref:NADH-ubiquinone oxidoreductase chain C n=1 Tax=hydrothermal vent metagenome TaxID=652676 RepID=A0A3B0XTN0_9ZZZZ